MKFEQLKHRPLLRGFSFVVRIVLGCLFLYSAVAKIRQPYDFLSSVYEYELVGPKLGMFVAIMLPWLELLVGICLVGGIFVGGALLASMAMAAMFTYVLVSALYRGLDISCGCFGGDKAVISYFTLLRAVAILVFSGAAYGCVLLFRPRSDNREPELGADAPAY